MSENDFICYCIMDCMSRSIRKAKMIRKIKQALIEIAVTIVIMVVSFFVVIYILW